MAMTEYVKFVSKDFEDEYKLRFNGIYHQNGKMDDRVCVRNDVGEDLKLEKIHFKNSNKKAFISFRNQMKNQKKLDGSGLHIVNENRKWKKKAIFRCDKCGTTFQATVKRVRRVPFCRNCSRGASFGEEVAISYLVENKVRFEKEKTYPSLKGVNGGKLRFDFYIYNPNGPNFLLEIDGEQHNLDSTSSWSKNTAENDKIKNEFCNEKGIYLVRLKYRHGHHQALANKVKKVLVSRGVVGGDDINSVDTEKIAIQYQEKSNNKRTNKEFVVEESSSDPLKKTRNKGKKRKKFYAIKVGKKSNVIVRTWTECKALTQGCGRSRFKSFKTREEAEAYLRS